MKFSDSRTNIESAFGLPAILKFGISPYQSVDLSKEAFHARNASGKKGMPVELRGNVFSDALIQELTPDEKKYWSPKELRHIINGCHLAIKAVGIAEEQHVPMIKNFLSDIEKYTTAKASLKHEVSYRLDLFTSSTRDLFSHTAQEKSHLSKFIYFPLAVMNSAYFFKNLCNSLLKDAMMIARHNKKSKKLSYAGYHSGSGKIIISAKDPRLFEYICCHEVLHKFQTIPEYKSADVEFLPSFGGFTIARPPSFLLYNSLTKRKLELENDYVRQNEAKLNNKAHRMVLIPVTIAASLGNSIVSRLGKEKGNIFANGLNCNSSSIGIAYRQFLCDSLEEKYGTDASNEFTELFRTGSDIKTAFRETVRKYASNL